MSIHTTGSNLAVCLEKVNSKYVVLQYTASESNLSKMYPMTEKDLMLNEFKGDYDVSVLPWDATDDTTALTKAIYELGRSCVVWGPSHRYGETISVTL